MSNTDSMVGTTIQRSTSPDRSELRELRAEEFSVISGGQDVIVSRGPPYNPNFPSGVTPNRSESGREDTF